MTTEVIVKAGGAWPVAIVALSPSGGATGLLALLKPDECHTTFAHAGQDLLIGEVTGFVPGEEPVLQYFAFAHLPENLRIVSRPFAALAQMIVTLLPRNPERSVALRKLLEAKDCAVRAAVTQP